MNLTPFPTMWQRLKQSLQKTSAHFQNRWKNWGKALEAEDIEWLQEALMMADVGWKTTEDLLSSLKAVTWQEALIELREKIHHRLRCAHLTPTAEEEIPEGKIFFMLGSNGSGKTTMLGKWIHHWSKKKHPIVVAAADTFRAAATDQLRLWLEKNSQIEQYCTFISGQNDPASIVYKALDQWEALQKEHPDSPCTLFIDSAGRLPNNVNLLNQLKKMYSMIQQRSLESISIPLLSLDATNGQYVLHQAQEFSKAIDLKGYVINKMDSSAKGGFILPLINALPRPIYAIGTGEGLQDWSPFHAETYAQALLPFEAPPRPH